MKKLSLNVKGMHCPSCEMLVTDSLTEIKGIEKAEAFHKKGKVDVSFDEKLVSEKQIKETIKKEGYEVE
jgi:copper chaperone CopZ